MYRIMSPSEAVALIQDGDCIAINSFLALSNPEQLHNALAERYKQSGHPGMLRLFCAAGFGAWDESRFADQYIAMGAVAEIIAGHYGSMPAAVRMACENRLEAYNLPLGVLSHTVRAAASGQEGVLSRVGLNIFADPRVDTCGLNDRSTQKLVELVTVKGKEYLYYKAPKIDIAFLKGTTADPNGNISFEREYLTVDALALAQATKANGGKVIVQVERVSHNFARPRNVIVPGILVDAVVVCEEAGPAAGYNPTMSGDIHVPPAHMDYYMSKLSSSRKQKPHSSDESADVIGARAAKELCPGQVVNIGIGIPEMVGKHASRMGILKDIATTVESGGIGGLPAPGVAFGATIGADMICDMATQFDFYDGGGLDICFMGGLEVDRYGNVNAHKLFPQYSGIGGFANITYSTPVVVFCINFTTKGLVARRDGSRVRIEQEGRVRKFKETIGAVSFSARNALEKGQKVLYVTERCVFGLTEKGLCLLEVFEGIDKERDILALQDYSGLEVAQGLV